MSDNDKIYVEASECVCIVPREFITEMGDGIALCAGVQLVQLDEDRFELVLLSEADVERLTSPEGSA